MFPQISVIIPAHNATQTLGLQLSSLVRQHAEIQFEILVCDNNSSDNLANWLKPWIEQYPFIRYIEAFEAPGAGYTRNVGVSYAQADKLAFCDADDVVSEHWVKSAYEALEKTTVVTGSIHTVFEENFRSFESIEASDAYISRKIDQIDDPNLYPVAKGSLAPVLLGGNFAMTKEQYLALKGFDAYFAQGSEDNDFAYRIMQAGIELKFCPTMGILYRIRRLNLSLLKRSYINGASFAELCAKHNVWAQAVPYQNFTVLTIPKALVKALLSLRDNSSETKITEWSNFLTVIALGIGKLEACLLRKRPVDKTGLGLKKKE